MASGLYVCSRDFLGAYLPEYRSLINKLRKEGYEIEDKRCDMHVHEGRMNMWRLIKIPRTETISGSGCCYSFLRFGIHSNDCVQHQDRKPVSLFK